MHADRDVKELSKSQRKLKELSSRKHDERVRREAQRGQSPWKGKNSGRKAWLNMLQVPDNLKKPPVLDLRCSCSYQRPW